LEHPDPQIPATQTTQAPVSFMLIGAWSDTTADEGGPAVVGGPIEIATITADRGFRWH
jgi:hypothetical protein